MKRGVLIAATILGGCGDQPQPGPQPPPPWISGTDVRAQLHVADGGFQGLAGRKNTSIDFACAVDPAGLPGFKDCPAGVWKLYRNVDCTGYDLGLGMHEQISQYAEGIANDFYQKVGEYTGFAVSPAADGTCTVPNGTRTWPVLAPFDPAPLRLGALTSHTYNGVDYTSLDVDDGFSVVVGIEGPTSDVVDDTGARLRARYKESGGVREYVGVFDAQLGVNCEIRDDPGGQLRCVSGGLAASVTSDVTCRDFANPRFSESPTLLTYREDTTVPFFPRTRLDKVLRCVPTTRQLYEGLFPTQCRPVSDPSKYLECSEALSFDMFATVSLTVE